LHPRRCVCAAPLLASGVCRSVSEVSVDFADEVPLVSFTCLMFLRAVMFEAMPLDVEYAIVLDNDLREWGWWLS